MNASIVKRTVMVVGYGKCGKSVLIEKLRSGNFNAEYTFTNEPVETIIERNGVEINLIDVPVRCLKNEDGQNYAEVLKFVNSRPDIDVMAICFDQTSKRLMRQAEWFLWQLYIDMRAAQLRERQPDCLLIFTKQDITPSNDETREMLNELLEEYSNVFRVSAKTGYGISNLIDRMRSLERIE